MASNTKLAGVSSIHICGCGSYDNCTAGTYDKTLEAVVIKKDTVGDRPMRVHYGSLEQTKKQRQALAKKECYEFVINTNYRECEKYDKYRKMDKPKLVEECKEKDLDAVGKPTTLISRLMTWRSWKKSTVAKKGSGEFKPPQARFVNVRPKHVEVSSSIKAVTEINVKDGSFTVDFTLMLDWFDPALVNSEFISKEEAEESEEPSCKPSWFPEFIIDNLISEVDNGDASARAPRINDSGVGTAKITMRRQTTLRAMYNVKNFPFDVSFLPIVLRSISEKVDRRGREVDGRTYVNLVDGGNIRKPPKSSVLKTMDGTSLSIPIAHEVARKAKWTTEFDFHPTVVSNDFGATIESLDDDDDLSPEEIDKEREHLLDDDKYAFGIIAKRDPTSVTYNVTIYALLIQASAMLVWGFSPSDLGQRSAVILQLMVATMGFKSSIQEKLPDVNYKTKLDLYIFENFVVLTLIAVMSFFIALFAEEQSTQVETLKSESGSFALKLNNSIQEHGFAECVDFVMFLIWFYRLTVCTYRLFHSGKTKQDVQYSQWNKVALMKNEPMKLTEFAALWDITEGWYSTRGNDRGKIMKKRREKMSEKETMSDIMMRIQQAKGWF
jgi:hypothetical protein